MATHYETLGVSSEATTARITAAFHHLRGSLQERVNRGDAAALTSLRELEKAYLVLSEPSKRRAHDRWIAQQIGKPAQQPTPEPSVDLRTPRVPVASPPPARTPITTDESKWSSWVLGFCAIAIMVAGGAVLMSNAPSQTDARSAPPTSDDLESSEAIVEAWPAYITTTMANVRAGPDARAAVVNQLHEWSQVSVVGQEGSWSQVQFVGDGAGTSEGYVATRLLTAGTAQDARVAYCDVPASGRPHSGEILEQASTGSHTIKINAGPRDALIKLRRNGATQLAFYVRAQETGEVSNLADGAYQVMFATGEQFSRKCLEFVTEMNVSADPDVAVFRTRREQTWEGVTVYSSIAEYTLTEQAGGNFRPQDLDSAAFRE